MVSYSVPGLKPNSQYKFWFNGVDMTWACRQPGTRMGAGLTSDSTGTLQVMFHSEMFPEVTNSKANSGTTVQSHTASLTDINGNVVAQSISTKRLIGKQI
jgi:hypothetical protein